MALVSDGFRLTVTLVDTGANTTSKTFDLTAADYATALADSAAIMASLNGVTDALVKGYSIAERYIENTPGLPLAAEISDRASVLVQLASNPFKKETIEIPAPIAGMFQGASGDAWNLVNVANAALGTFLAHFALGAEATISDGETIETPALKGKRIHVASRNG